MAGVNLPTYMDEAEQVAREKEGRAAPTSAPPKYVDPMQLHPLLSMPIPKGVEYMSVEDPQASAGWGDSLMQQTGTAFLVAGGIGTFLGTLEGIKQTTGNPHMKLRVNGILNGMEKRGLLFANTAAAGVLTFHLLKKISSLARGNDEDEAVNFIGSATVVGGMMGAARGARPGIVGALIGATCGAIAFLGNHQLVPQLHEFDDSQDINPPNSVLYHSASYETTPLLSFAGTNNEPPPPVLHSSGRNYNQTSNSKYSSNSKYNSTTKYTASGRAYQEVKPQGLNAVLLTVVLQSIGFTLVLPSMFLYLQALGGDKDFFGWIVAIYSVGSFIGAMIFGWWSDHRTAKEGILVATVISVGGNCLYCSIGLFKTEYGHWIMLVARFLVGFGSGCVAVCRAYCAENTDIRNKVKMMAAVSGAQGIGFVVGPGLGSILSFLDFHIGIFEVNQFTSPGYLSAVFCVLCFFIVSFLMPAVSSQKKDEARVNSSEDEMKVPIYICLFLFFATVTVFAVFETDFTILSSKDFQWGTFSNSIYFLVAAIISTIMYIIIGVFPKLRKVDDRKATAVGLLLLIIGMMCFMVYSKPWKLEEKLTMTQLVLGGVVYSIGYPVASTYIFALYSKILNPQIQGSKMGWITGAGSIARMVGPIWASSALLKWGDSIMFGGTAIFLAVALIVLFVGYRVLIPHKDYGKDLSMNS